jgi:hypothetical protein
MPSGDRNRFAVAFLYSVASTVAWRDRSRTPRDYAISRGDKMFPERNRTESAERSNSHEPTLFDTTRSEPFKNRFCPFATWANWRGRQRECALPTCSQWSANRWVFDDPDLRTVDESPRVCVTRPQERLFAPRGRTARCGPGCRVVWGVEAGNPDLPD